MRAGPTAIRTFADLGARVIKVENPHRGDSLRSKPRAFDSLNHGKEVVRLDLASESGRAQAWALFDQCNVVVDNMRPGVLEQFGFGESELRKKKPDLIHCCMAAAANWLFRKTRLPSSS